MLTIPSIVLYPRGGTLSWLCAMTFSSFRGFWYSPTSIRLHPPKPGTHQPKVGLNLHIVLCLSALTESEPHVRMGAQASYHCHNRSGKGVPSADFAGYILRAVTSLLGNLTNWNWEFQGTQLSSVGLPWHDSLSLSYRLHAFIARSFEVMAYGSSRLVGLLPAPVLLHTDVLIFNFQAAIPLRDIIIIAQNVSSVKDIQETLFDCTNVRFLR